MTSQFHRKIFGVLNSLTNYLISKLRLPYIGVISANVQLCKTDNKCLEHTVLIYILWPGAYVPWWFQANGISNRRPAFAIVNWKKKHGAT